MIVLQLRRYLADWLRKRRDVARRYREELVNLARDGRFEFLHMSSRSTPYKCTALSRDAEERVHLQAPLEEQGVKTERIYPVLVADQPKYRDGDFPCCMDGTLPVARDLVSRLICLPMHEFLTSEDVDGVIAGFETVSTAFINSAFNLLQRLDLVTQLRERLDDPARMAAAIEEILRVTPMGRGGGPQRIARRDDLELSGTTIKMGEVMMLDSRAANCDRSVFPRAQEVIFDRDPNPHVTFGRGMHGCLGQQSAQHTRLSRTCGRAAGGWKRMRQALLLDAHPDKNRKWQVHGRQVEVC